MIFVPNYVDICTPRTPLVYVQPFQFAQRPKGTTDVGTDMYSFVRQYRSNKIRKGLIVPLNRIWRLVELAPKFGRRCNKEWTCDTAVELAEKFYLNCFVDKPSYIEVYWWEQLNRVDNGGTSTSNCRPNRPLLSQTQVCMMYLDVTITRFLF